MYSYRHLWIIIHWAVIIIHRASKKLDWGLTKRKKQFDAYWIESKQSCVTECAEWFTSKRKEPQFYKWCLWRWGLILTILVNGCELNFGVFQSYWISEIVSACFSLSFWVEFAFVVSSSLWKYACMCSMSEIPPNGEITSGILLFKLGNSV